MICQLCLAGGSGMGCVCEDCEDRYNAAIARVAELVDETYNQSARIVCAEGRVAELEAGLEALLRSRPEGLECSDFSHAKADRHEGFDCPCDARWDAAVEAACNLLKR